jgi:hypothetical protein
MRQLRWIASVGLLAAGACSDATAPTTGLTCDDPDRPCDQLLAEISDRAETPYLADANTLVIGNAVVRRR